MVFIKLIYILFIILMCLYIIKQLFYTTVRVVKNQKMYYGDIETDRLESITVIVPVHNSGDMTKVVLDKLIENTYPKDKLEIIPVNYDSGDNSGEILEEYKNKYRYIRPLNCDKEVLEVLTAVNTAVKMARGNVIIVLDVTDRPTKEFLKEMALAFQDVSVGGVMARTIPVNVNTNLLTRLENIKMSGEFQVNSQAAFNMGTMGVEQSAAWGFRKEALEQVGGFSKEVIKEDKVVIYNLYLAGWKISYANSAEIYGRIPEDREEFGNSVRRMSKNENEIFLKFFIKILFSRKLNVFEKIDALLEITRCFSVCIFVGGILASFILLLTGRFTEYGLFFGIAILGGYLSLGSIASSVKSYAGLIIDEVDREMFIFPLATLGIFYYAWYLMLGFIDAIFKNNKGKW